MASFLPSCAIRRTLISSGVPVKPSYFLILVLDILFLMFSVIVISLNEIVKYPIIPLSTLSLSNIRYVLALCLLSNFAALERKKDSTSLFLGQEKASSIFW